MDAYADDDGERVVVLEGYRRYRRRWLMLGLFCLLSLSNALAWISFAPVSRLAAEYYQIREHWVSGLAMVYMLTYIGGVWIGAWVIEKKGLRFGVVIGAVLNMAGGLIRIGGADPDAFWITFLGQAVLGCAQVFILEVPPKLSANWFGQRQRSLATAIGLLSNQLGVGLGFFLAPFIVHRRPDLPLLLYVEAGLCAVVSVLAIVFFRGEAPSPPSAVAELRMRVKQLKAQGVVHPQELISVEGKKFSLPRSSKGEHEARLVATDTTTTTVMVAPPQQQQASDLAQGHTAEAGSDPSELWRKDSYQNGGFLPAESAVEEEVDLEDDDEDDVEMLKDVTVAWWTRSYWRNIRELLRDRNFMLLMFAFGIAVGAFYSILVLFGHLTPQTGREVGVLGMLFVGMGIAGSFVAGVVLDTTHEYGLFTKIGFGGLLVGYVWFFLAGAAGRNFIMMSFPCSFLGFFMAAIFTLCLETGVECTYPVPEGTTAGLQILCAQVFGVIFISVMEATRRFTIDARKATFAASNMILLGALVFSFILILFFKGENKRFKAEPSFASRRSSSSSSSGGARRVSART